MSKYAHTHPQRYLRKHDRVVGPKRKGNKKKRQQRKQRQSQGKAADKTRQDKISQDKTRQDKTRQDKTRQDKTRQDKTRQDKTRQHKTIPTERNGTFYHPFITQITVSYANMPWEIVFKNLSHIPDPFKSYT